MDSVATASIRPCWCSEQHGEYRHRQGHDQRDVADDRNAGERLVLAQDGFQRRRQRLELKRDVRHRAYYCDEGDRRSYRLALAITRADKIGDRDDVLRFRQLDHAAQQRRAQPDHQERADIDRQKIGAGAGGKSDRAEKRP
jgi:hypothetical protein